MVFWQRPQITEFNVFPTNGSTLELLHLSVHQSNLQKAKQNKTKKTLIVVCLLLQEGQDQFGFVSCNCTTHFSVFTSTEVTREKKSSVRSTTTSCSLRNETPPQKTNWTQLWKKNKNTLNCSKCNTNWLLFLHNWVQLNIHLKIKSH